MLLKTITERQRFCSIYTAKYRFSSKSGRPKKFEEPPKAYDPLVVEADWTNWWTERLNERNFSKKHTRKTDDEIFCLPPPNVTGNLHIGHALTVAIQDSYVRWRKMCGKNAVWVPGFDHAGIATQLMVEKWLKVEKNLSRHEMSRQKFFEFCLQWKEERAADIKHQLDRMGASLDWSRCFYTMDENFSKAVQYAFCHLHGQGLIFRDLRLVNWSPYLQSTLSDVEIDHVRVDQPTTLPLPGGTSVEAGVLYCVDYELTGSRPGDRKFSRGLTVATTRPETIPADEALAVHPQDMRYARFIGERCRNPLNPRKLLPVIGDEQVDPRLGTGVLKITPGHDRIDFEISQRHKLTENKILNNIFDDQGRISIFCPFEPIRNQDRFEARKIVVDFLQKSGKLAEIRPHSTILPICGRTGDLVELMPKNQWFLNCRPMADQILKFIEQGRFNFYPEFQKVLTRNWLEKTQDWCLSRQLWWGHRIPAYRVKLSKNFSNRLDAEKYVVCESEENARKILALSQSTPEHEIFVEQDEDVLDTWFSSALVPLVVSGWPGDGCLAERNLRSEGVRPLLSLMETGHDILGFWVTRMAMLGVHFTGRLPFEDILLHGIVRDGQGRKMSKSLGNVIDPVDVIEGKSLSELQRKIFSSNLPENEKMTSCSTAKKNFPKGIPQCGADALRFSLLSGDVKSVTMNINVDQIENKRHFCNKIWQGFNFMKRAWQANSYFPINSAELNKDPLLISRLTNEDLWILSRLANVVRGVSSGFDSFDFHVAVNLLYKFWWHDFCDIYLEYTKADIWKVDSPDSDQSRCSLICRIFLTVSDIFLRLSAPFMPFLTEQLYTEIPYAALHCDQARMHESVHDCPFPDITEVDFGRPEFDLAMKCVQSIVSGVRAMKKQFGMPYNELIHGFLVVDESAQKAVSLFPSILRNFAKFAYEVHSVEKFDTNSAHVRQHVFYMAAEGCQIYLKINDLEKSLILSTLEKQLAKKKKLLSVTQYRTDRSLKLSLKNPKLEPWDNSAILEKLDSEIRQIEDIYDRVRLNN